MVLTVPRYQCHFKPCVWHSWKDLRIPFLHFPHHDYPSKWPYIHLGKDWASQVSQWWRIYLPMQETQATWVQSLCQEDLLEKEMATYSSILAWKIPWTEEPGGLQSIGLQRVRHNWACTHNNNWENLMQCSRVHHLRSLTSPSVSRFWIWEPAQD